MISIYKDAVKDALFRKKGLLSKTNKYLHVASLEPFSAGEVHRLRLFLQLSQSMFASVLGVNTRTVISWENGTNVPSGPALRLMHILKKYPDVLIETQIVEETRIK